MRLPLTLLALAATTATANTRARLTVTNHANPEWNYITIRFSNTAGVLEEPIITVDPIGDGTSVVRINHLGDYIDTEWPHNNFMPDSETFVVEFETGTDDVAIQNGWLRRNGNDVGSFNADGEITSPNGRPAGRLELSLEIITACPADLDGDEDADADDFFLYLDAFAAGDPSICDIDADADCDADDFFAYLDSFAQGC